MLRRMFLCKMDDAGCRYMYYDLINRLHYTIALFCQK